MSHSEGEQEVIEAAAVEKDVSTIVNHHEPTIWENMFSFFQTSNRLWYLSQS